MDNSKGVGATALSHPHQMSKGTSSSSSQQRHPRQQRDTILSKYNITTTPTTSDNDQYPKIKIPNANRSIAFVHIGKTGGSTISMHIRNGCHEYYMDPCLDRQKDGWIINETVASHRIESYYHLGGIPPDKLDHFTTIVTAVRNPIARFLSAFAYGHPTNAIATKVTLDVKEQQQYSCFPSMSYLVKAAMGRAEIPWNKAHLHKIRDATMGRRRRFTQKFKLLENNMPPINCTELARIAFGLNPSWNVVNATHPWPSHMTHDYRQYYKSSMPPEKELMVLRHDHMWDDWVQINKLLSSSSSNAENNNDSNSNVVAAVVPPFREIHRNVSSGYLMKKRWDVETREERLWLCMLLHEEIRTYLMILRRAINLGESDLLEAASDVNDMCK